MHEEIICIYQDRIHVFNTVAFSTFAQIDLRIVYCTNALFNDSYDQSFDVQSRTKLEIKRGTSFLTDLFLRRSKSAPV